MKDREKWDFLNKTGWLGYFIIGLGIIVLSAAIAAALMSILTFLFGDNSTAATYVSITSGLSTIILVAVTAWYAYETRNLVRQSERAREEEKEFRELERQQDVNMLRRALLEEIRSVEDLHELARDFDLYYTGFEQIVPSNVYENSTDAIGRLTKSEVKAVVEFYTVAAWVEEHFKMVREQHTEFGMSRFERIWYALSLEWYFERNKRKAMIDVTTQRLSTLAEAQTKAIHELESELREGNESNDES